MLGDKSEVMYVSGITDAATRATNRTATPGYPFTVEGNYLKLAGEDPSVGIYLVDEDGTETRIDPAMVAVNEPKKLVFVIPATMEAGTYTLRVVTQYVSSGNLLKTPRTLESTVYIGVTPTTPGDDGDGEEEDGGQSGSPL